MNAIVKSVKLKSLIASTILILSGCHSTPQVVESIKPTPQETITPEKTKIEQIKVLLPGYPIAVDKEVLNDYNTYLSQDDTGAAQQLINDGSIVLTDNYQNRAIATTSFNWDKSEFRFVGTTQTFWTMSEAITLENVQPTVKTSSVLPLKALVFDPPSNVRYKQDQSSEVFCTIDKSKEIAVSKTDSDWYMTDACMPTGRYGYIHKSQIKVLQ